jgi:type IV pilus assembly protein PilV
MKTRARSRSQRGLSLIEVMIALTILAVGMLGALAMQTHALSSTNTGKHVSDAMRIGLDRLETLKYQGWASTPVAGWTAPAAVTGPESVAARAGEVPQQFNVSWRVQAVAGLDPNRIREIDVRVTWREAGDNPGMLVRRYAISSFKYNGAGTPP